MVFFLHASFMFTHMSIFLVHIASKIRGTQICYLVWMPKVFTSTAPTANSIPTSPFPGVVSATSLTVKRRYVLKTSLCQSAILAQQRSESSICQKAPKRNPFCNIVFLQFTIKPLDKKKDVFKFYSSQLRVNKLVSSAPQKVPQTWLCYIFIN